MVFLIGSVAGHRWPCEPALLAGVLVARGGPMRIVHRWQILVIALAVAIIGFLSIHRYNPTAGLIWNFINAEIHLTRECNPSLPWELYQQQNPSLWRGHCGIKLPYAWLLSGVIAFAAIALILPEHSGAKLGRALRAIPWSLWLVVAVVGFVAWAVQLQTTTEAVTKRQGNPFDQFDGLPPAGNPPAARTSPAVVNLCAERTQPQQGLYRAYTRDADVASLTIKTAAGANYFVKLEDAATGAPVRSFHVKGGSTMTTRVPLGTFVLKYASGISWCNEDDLFGPDTATNRADDVFAFERQVTGDGHVLSHWTVELVLQRHGNLRTRSIPRSQF
jgi:hypothetical protein